MITFAENRQDCTNLVIIVLKLRKEKLLKSIKVFIKQAGDHFHVVLKDKGI